MSIISKENYLKLQTLSKFQKVTIPVIETALDCSNHQARFYSILFNNEDELKAIFGDQDMVGANVKLAKQKQFQQDKNRIETKAFRDYVRMENALKSLNEALIAKLDDVTLNIRKPVNTQPIRIGGDQAIIQLADTHFNELVDLEDNTYDFDIASKRMALYAAEVKRELRGYDVTKVILAMTGDMINSDRRLDEKLNMSTNRASATLIAAELIEYFIADLMEEFDEMDVLYVTGNESRAWEFGFTDMVATDNYDSIVFNIMERTFRKIPNVNFIRSNPIETVLSVNGKNILMLHGTTLGASAQGNVQKFVGKYANKGTTVHYTIFGHIHFSNIGDTFARSGSLVGSNTYSEFGLGLITKPSQNLHIIQKNGTINNKRIELSCIDGIKGYPISDLLDVYNAKSASKAHREYKVIEIERSASL